MTTYESEGGNIAAISTFPGAPSLALAVRTVASLAGRAAPAAGAGSSGMAPDRRRITPAAMLFTIVFFGLGELLMPSKASAIVLRL